MDIIKGINDGIKNWNIRWDRFFQLLMGLERGVHIFLIFFLCLSCSEVFYLSKKKKKSNEASPKPCLFAKCRILLMVIKPEKVSSLKQLHIKNKVLEIEQRYTVPTEN